MHLLSAEVALRPKMYRYVGRVSIDFCQISWSNWDILYLVCHYIDYALCNSAHGGILRDPGGSQGRRSVQAPGLTVHFQVSV